MAVFIGIEWCGEIAFSFDADRAIPAEGWQTERMGRWLLRRNTDRPAHEIQNPIQFSPPEIPKSRGTPDAPRFALWNMPAGRRPR